MTTSCFNSSNTITANEQMEHLRTILDEINKRCSKISSCGSSVKFFKKDILILIEEDVNFFSEA